MLGDINKLFVFKSLLTKTSNDLPLQLKPIIWILPEVEGDRIKSRLPFKIFSTLMGTEHLPHFRKNPIRVLNHFDKKKIKIETGHQILIYIFWNTQMGFLAKWDNCVPHCHYETCRYHLANIPCALFKNHLVWITTCGSKFCRPIGMAMWNGICQS